MEYQLGLKSSLVIQCGFVCDQDQNRVACSFNHWKVSYVGLPLINADMQRWSWVQVRFWCTSTTFTTRNPLFSCFCSVLLVISATRAQTRKDEQPLPVWRESKAMYLSQPNSVCLNTAAAAWLHWVKATESKFWVFFIFVWVFSFVKKKTALVHWRHWWSTTTAFVSSLCQSVIFHLFWIKKSLFCRFHFLVQTYHHQKLV